MNTLLLFLMFVVFFGLLILMLRFWFKRLEEKSKISEELIEWLKSSTSSVDQKLSESMKLFNDRLDNAARVIGNVQKSIGEFSEIGRSMQELQEFLRSPKLRGNIGEQVLKEILNQHLPRDFYRLQYAFKNGEKVDAVIKTADHLIPVDSKFPIENFRRIIAENSEDMKKKYRKEFEQDVKKHITDIARKYIVVDEGTVDYAIMYIPSESVYYEIISNADLYDFSGKKRVLPVSPMGFYAYLKAILMSFEGQRIQSQAREILSILSGIKKDYEKTDESLSVLTKHITNSYNQLGQVSKSFSSLGQKLSSTKLLSKQEKLIE